MNSALAFLLVGLFVCIAPIRAGQVQFNIAIWVGDDTDKTNSKSLPVPRGSTLMDAMNLAAEGDDDIEYYFEKSDTGEKLRGIGDVLDDPESSKYWVFYALDDSPDSNEPPTSEPVAGDDIDGSIINSDTYYLFWYKTVKA